VFSGLAVYGRTCFIKPAYHNLTLTNLTYTYCIAQQSVPMLLDALKGLLTLLLWLIFLKVTKFPVTANEDII